MGAHVWIGGGGFPKKKYIIPLVIVDTPHEAYKMILRRSIRTASIQTVVIHKADEMLYDSYTNLIKEMLTNLGEDKHVTLLASEKHDRILDIYKDSLLDPLIITNEDDKKEDSDITKSM